MKFRTWLALVALAISGTAVAGPYTSGAFALSKRNGYSDVDQASGSKFAVGYRFEDSPLMLELNYLDAGDATVDSLGGADLSYSGFSGLAGWRSQQGGRGFSYWAAGGFYQGDTRLTDTNGFITGVPGASIQQSASGAALSLGVAWMFDANSGLQFAVDNLYGVKDFSHDETLTTFSMGVVYAFPNQRKAVATSAGPYIPPYLRTPGAAGAIDQTSPASRPAPPAEGSRPAISASPGVPGATRIVGEKTWLLRQPQIDSEAEAGVSVPLGASVVLKRRHSDAGGDWWLVEYNGASGWISETILH